MKKTSKNIGEFYKEHLDDLEIPGGHLDWDRIGIKMEKAKFYRFGWSYFNIYYALLIISSFLFSSIVLVDYFSRARNAGSVSSQIENKDSKNEARKQPTAETHIDKKNPESEMKKEDGFHSQQFDIKKIDSLKKDTVFKKQEKDSVSIKSPRNELKKVSPEIIYIIKQDTIVVIDSLKTHKGRRKVKP